MQASRDTVGDVELLKVRQRAHLVSERHHGKRRIESEAPAECRIFGAFRNLRHARGRGGKGTLAKLAQRPLEHRAQLQRRVVLHIGQRRRPFGGRYGFPVIARKTSIVALKDIQLSKPPYIAQFFSQDLGLIQPGSQQRDTPQTEQRSRSAKRRSTADFQCATALRQNESASSASS